VSWVSTNLDRACTLDSLNKVSLISNQFEVNDKVDNMIHTNTSETRNGLESKWLILTAVMLGTFMTPLDGNIVNTVLPSITAFFNTEISIVQWVPTVYLLAICCLILLYGRQEDIYGYKRIFLYGLAAFTVTSILYGTSRIYGC